MRALAGLELPEKKQKGAESRPSGKERRKQKVSGRKNGSEGRGRVAITSTSEPNLESEEGVGRRDGPNGFGAVILKSFGTAVINS